MKNYINKFLFVTILIAITASLFPKPVNLSEAQTAAENLLRERKYHSSQKRDINLQSVQYDDDLLYIFNESDTKTFVMIAGDNAAYPVLGYAKNYSYFQENMPPALTELINNYKTQLNEIKINNYPPSEKTKNAWSHYLNSDFTPARTDSVAPLITTLWNQCKYYNAMCPEDAEGVDGHVVVGCVATAMSQIMHYYRYPLNGTGSSSYYNYDYGWQEANYGETTYNWDNMPDYLTDYNDDIALLSYQCGVSVEMNYGAHGSGASSSDVVYSLQDYFDYNEAMEMHYKDNYNESEWNSMLKENLDQRMPVHYSGFGESSGHAFVCDGYEGDNHFHFNWGWDGLFNGYYYLDNLNPRTSNFSQYQQAIFNIYPNTPPVAQATANNFQVKTGSAVKFTDLSQYRPNSWNWTFAGGSPAYSDQQNPEVVYNSPGSYDVFLEVSNMYGDDSFILSQTIEVADDFAPIAAFTVSDSIIPTAAQMQLTDTSLNSPTGWEWSFEPNAITYHNQTDSNSQNPIVSFQEAGEYTVSLTVSDANHTDTITRENIIKAGGLNLPYEEKFEISLSTNDWLRENPDNEITWDGIYFSGGNLPDEKSVGLNFRAYENTGERDKLISPLLNFSNQTDIELNFWHAYANYVTPKNDSLIIKISTDNGSSWERLLALSDASDPNFSTHTPMETRFVPNIPSDWSDDYAIDLSNYADMANIRLCFETYNDNGNCLYLDKVSITGNVNYQDNAITASQIFLKNYPNPFNPETNIEFSLPEPAIVKLTIFNLKGQQIKKWNKHHYNAGKHSLVWNGTDTNNKRVSSGIYFYKVSIENGIEHINKCILLK